CSNVNYSTTNYNNPLQFISICLQSNISYIARRSKPYFFFYKTNVRNNQGTAVLRYFDLEFSVEICGYSGGCAFYDNIGPGQRFVQFGINYSTCNNALCKSGGCHKSKNHCEKPIVNCLHLC